MRAVDLIMKKRDGGSFAGEEIDFLVQGFTRGDIPDYQFASLLMAIVLKGMSAEETAQLTSAMIASGEVLDLSGVPGPLVDKHSTGGVGDKISLVLAPLAAACGVRVPMMSGRSLGHTGGTLDKLESIPGYRTNLSPERFRAALAEIGFAMIGQSETIVPADRRIYALRDVTGTVESIPLITASIMSKKFAEGAQSLVFDVKTGSGAFMKSSDNARALARSLVATGEGAWPRGRGGHDRHGPATGNEDRQLSGGRGKHRLPQRRGAAEVIERGLQAHGMDAHAGRHQPRSKGRGEGWHARGCRTEAPGSG